MAKGKIVLNIEFVAVFQKDDEFIPVDEVTATEQVSLVIPGMDSKFVVLPKVLEGVTDKVITQLNGMVGEWYRKKAEEEKRRKEEEIRPSFWSNGATLEKVEAN